MRNNFEKAFAVAEFIQPYCVTLKPENMERTYGEFMARLLTTFDTSAALTAELDWIDNEYNGIVTQTFSRYRLPLTRENWLSVATIVSHMYHINQF